MKFPAEINEFNGTITKGVVNGNTFFQVAVEVNGTARNVSINSLFRSFNDRENGKRITPVDILPEADKDKCIFNMFENKTIAECLADLQGTEVTAKAIETFESVARDGSQMNSKCHCILARITKYFLLKGTFRKSICVFLFIMLIQIYLLVCS